MRMAKSEIFTDDASHEPRSPCQPDENVQSEVFTFLKRGSETVPSLISAIERFSTQGAKVMFLRTCDGFQNHRRRCKSEVFTLKVAGLQVEESRIWRPKVSFSRLELDVDFEIGRRCQSEKVALGDWYERKRIRQAYSKKPRKPNALAVG